jgi:hypothetical protein
MSFRSRASIALFGFLFTLVPSIALAQVTPGAITMDVANKASLERLDSNAKPIGKRSQALNPEGVNLQDCRDSQFIRFPLLITGSAPNLTGEVWATDSGANCSEAVQRSGSGVQQCYRLDNIGFIITPTQSIDIPVRQLIKGVGDQSATTGADGCRRLNSSTVNVWFLALAGTQASGQLTLPVRVDTQGPRPLSNVRAQPGDTRLTVAWDSVGEGGADDVIGAVAYCDPDPVPAGASDASTEECTTPEAGPDGATPEPTCTTVPAQSGAGDPIPQPGNIESNGSKCETQSFAPVGGKPRIPDSALSAKYGCGNITGTTGNTIEIKDFAGGPLVNRRTYAVAVAATDSFANVGELSTPICQFPEETSDFWRDYRESGGESGGGFCSVEGPGVPVGSFSLMAVGIVVGCSFLRRWRLVRGRRNDR